jgi:methylmalonyl-CoA mutase cobalamin-binding subunit
MLSMRPANNLRNPSRILLAKVGLYGHDTGIQVVTVPLRNEDMDVTYAELYQTLKLVADAAIQENYNVIGLNILSGVNLGLAQKLLDALRSAGADEIPVVDRSRANKMAGTHAWRQRPRWPLSRRRPCGRADCP